MDRSCPAVAQQPKLVPGPYVIAYMHRHAAWCQMRVHRIAATAEVQNYVITRNLGNRQAPWRRARRLIRQVTHRFPHCAVRDRQHVNAVAWPILRPLPVSPKRFSLSVHLDPVDRKLLRRIQRSIHRIGDESMWPDFQAAPVRVHHPSPLNGALRMIAARVLTLSGGLTTVDSGRCLFSA